MKNSLVKIVTAASLGILINSTVVPAKAQTAEETTPNTETTSEVKDKKAAAEKPELPQDMRKWLAIGIGGVAVLAVMVGTGNSMKHEKEAMKKSRANRGISNPSVRS